MATAKIAVSPSRHPAGSISSSPLALICDESTSCATRSRFDICVLTCVCVCVCEIGLVEVARSCKSQAKTQSMSEKGPPPRRCRCQHAEQHLARCPHATPKIVRRRMWGVRCRNRGRRLRQGLTHGSDKNHKTSQHANVNLIKLFVVATHTHSAYPYLPL
jgi:hypothetical protein